MRGKNAAVRRGAGPATAPLFAFWGRLRGYHSSHGALAQLGERLVCNQEVAGSIPAGSIRSLR